MWVEFVWMVTCKLKFIFMCKLNSKKGNILPHWKGALELCSLLLDPSRKCFSAVDAMLGPHPFYTNFIRTLSSIISWRFFFWWFSPIFHPSRAIEKNLNNIQLFSRGWVSASYSLFCCIWPNKGNNGTFQ